MKKNVKSNINLFFDHRFFLLGPGGRGGGEGL